LWAEALCEWQSKCTFKDGRSVRNRESGTLPIASAKQSVAGGFGGFMNAAITAPLAAIAGSLVGALGSSVATWITVRHQDRRDLLGKQIVQREALYSDFISESVRLLADAMQHNTTDLQTLLPIYALISRIRLSSSQPVLHEAEQVINIIVSTYPQPNLTAEQIESRAMNGDDPLRKFSDICRIELDSLERGL
jgi:hypothetical protein